MEEKKELIQYDDQTLEKLSFFYSIFADKTRISLISLLSNDIPYCVSDISEKLNMSQSRVSHQLAILRKLGIVKFDRNGKKKYYTLLDNHIKTIFMMGLEHINEDGSNVYLRKKKIKDE